MRNLFCLVLLVLLTACAIPMLHVSPYITPQAMQWRVDKNGTPTLVVAVAEQDNWRWIWTDALGLPIARQTLHRGEWLADGLLPPNQEALALFTALMWLGSHETVRQEAFPTASLSNSNPLTLQAHGKTLFRYDCSLADLTQCLTQPHVLTIPNNRHYTILPLTE